MDQLRKHIVTAIRGDCAVAAGIIACFIFALFPFPDVALRAGAVITAIVAAVLAITAKRLPHTSYRNIAIWHSLERNPRIPENQARRAVIGILVEEYLRHAEYVAWVAAAMWVIGTVFLYA